MIKLWLAEIPPRGKLYLALLLAALLAAPLFVDGYLLSVLVLVFYFAYLGQAWNRMPEFPGYNRRLWRDEARTRIGKADPDARIECLPSTWDGRDGICFIRKD